MAIALRRIIDYRLHQWLISKNRKPLILTGSRGVGKTFSTLLFAVSDIHRETHFSKVIYVNFKDQNGVQAKEIFKEYSNPKKIFLDLNDKYKDSLYYNNSNTKHKEESNQLLILDEIQKCDDAIKSLVYFNKFFPQLNVIGITPSMKLKNKDIFEKVLRYVDTFQVFPLSFFEFLANIHDGFNYPEIIDREYRVNKLHNDHDNIFFLFKKYLMIGGYPSIVSYYNSIHEQFENYSPYQTIFKKQLDILDSYLNDILESNISITNFNKCNEIINAVAKNLVTFDNEKFQYTIIKNNIKSQDYELPLNFLIDSNMLLKQTKTTKCEIPLQANSLENFYKLYLSDPGILSSLIVKDKYQFIYSYNSIDYKIRKALLLNFIANELSVFNIDLHYPQLDSYKNIDFIIEFKDKIYPIELQVDNDPSKIHKRGQLKDSDKLFDLIRLTESDFNQDEYNIFIRDIPIYALSTQLNNLADHKLFPLYLNQPFDLDFEGKFNK